MSEDAVWTDAADTMPVEILRQTFQVRSGAGIGTAFTVEVDGRQYIVTAQHLVGSTVPDMLDMQAGSAGWHQVPVTPVGVAGPPVDVAVMATDSVLGSRSTVPIGVGTVGYGQAVRFLGYPFGLDFTAIPGVRTEPLPFIKAGILSALRPVQGEAGLLELFRRCCRQSGIQWRTFGLASTFDGAGEQRRLAFGWRCYERSDP